LRRGSSIWKEPCDYAAIGFGLVPNLELPLLLGCAIDEAFVVVDEWQQSSLADVYCAGEPTGIGGLDLALTGGEIAGYAATGQSDRARRLFAARDRAVRFRDRLAATFALRGELKAITTEETIVCRCEDVPLSRLRGHSSWRSAKLHTRCGMGPCQGRMCGPAVEFLCGWRADSMRPPLYPIPVKAVL
jgi:NADPH-dependent 2,4-dienoyl-CoA reductase/sulfur reductase-like enzyme